MPEAYAVSILVFMELALDGQDAIEPVRRSGLILVFVELALDDALSGSKLYVFNPCFRGTCS